MPLNKGQNILTVVFPFYIVLKIFGMFPVSFDGNPKFGIFRVNWYDRITSAVALIILICISLVHASGIFLNVIFTESI